MVKRITAVVVGALILLVGAEAIAMAATKFTSCDQMHRVYKYGIAQDKHSQERAVHEGMYRLSLKPTVYAASYKTLDRDKDGVMCEVPR